MLTCVCKGTKALLEPNASSLPFWGLWVTVMRQHSWREVQFFMNIKCKHLKGLHGVSESLDERRKNSPRTYNLKGVWDFMLKEYGGTAEDYAKSILSFRKYRKIAIKRRIAFVAKHVGDDMELEEVCSMPIFVCFPIFTDNHFSGHGQWKTSWKKEEGVARPGNQGSRGKDGKGGAMAQGRGFPDTL